MRTYILLLFSALLLFISCEEIGLKENSNDISYLWFSKDSSKDSTSVSFKFYDTDTIQAYIEVSISGALLDKDSEFALYADLEETTLPADKYSIPEKFLFKAGKFVDTVHITLINFPELATGYMRLVLRVKESAAIQTGEINYQKAILSVSDKVFQPEWWRVLDGGRNAFNLAERFYVGAYSEKKMLMLLDEVDEGVELDGFNKSMLRKYALKLKNTIKAFNENPENIAMGLVPLMDEDNHEPMTIPVN